MQAIAVIFDGGAERSAYCQTKRELNTAASRISSEEPLIYCKITRSLLRVMALRFVCRR